MQCSSANLMKEPSVTTKMRESDPRMKKNLILLSRRSTGQISMLCSKTASAALGPIIHQGRIPADARFF